MAKGRRPSSSPSWKINRELKRLHVPSYAAYGTQTPGKENTLWVHVENTFNRGLKDAVRKIAADNGYDLVDTGNVEGVDPDVFGFGGYRKEMFHVMRLVKRR